MEHFLLVRWAEMRNNLAERVKNAVVRGHEFIDRKVRCKHNLVNSYSMLVGTTTSPLAYRST